MGSRRFRIRKSFSFEASHQLPNHDGKCQRLHGHSWKGHVVVCSLDSSLQETGPKAGMLMDFGDLSLILKPLVDEYLDHYHLNDSTGLANPTSEELARWIYDKLNPLIPKNALLEEVRIEETCTSEASYGCAY